MDLFNRIFSAFSVKTDQSFKDDVNLWKPLGGAKNKKVDEYLRDFSGYLYPVIMAIVDEFGTLKVRLVDKDEKEVEMHPALTSLFEVNKGDTYSELLEQWVMFMSTVGEAYWYLPKARVSDYREIHTLHPLAITDIKFDKWGHPESYEYKLANDKTEKFKADEVIFSKMPNPLDLSRGKAPVSSASLPLDTNTYAMEYNRNFFYNNATPDTVLQLKSGKLSSERKTRLLADWLSRFQGINKAHKPAILEGDLDVKTLSSTLKDMAFKDMHDITKKQVLSNWRVPKTIIGEGEDVNRATADTQDYVFTKRVIVPMARRFVGFLTEKYLPMFEGKEAVARKGLHFIFDNPVEDDITNDLQLAQAGVGSRQFMSINEARVQLGLEPVEGEAYDKVPEPSQAPVIPPKEDGKEDEGKDDDKDKSLVVKKKEAIKKKLDELHEKYGKNWKEDWYERYLKLAESWEKTFAKKFSPYFEEAKERIVPTVKQSGGSFTFDYDSSKEMIDMQTRAYGVLSQCVRDFWDLADELTPDLAPTPTKAWELTPEVEALIRNQVELMAWELDWTTRDALFEILAEAVQREYSIDWVQAKMEEYFGWSGDTRIYTIARTEINTTASLIQHYRYQQAERAGFIDKIEWHTTEDGRERRGHREMNRKTKKVDDIWTVPVYGGKKETELLYWENLKVVRDPECSDKNRINCRCAEIPVLE